MSNERIFELHTDMVNGEPLRGLYTVDTHQRIESFDEVFKQYDYHNVSHVSVNLDALTLTNGSDNEDSIINAAANHGYNLIDTTDSTLTFSK